MLNTLLLALVVAAAPWQPVPLVTAEQRAAGNLGGEGGQWLRALAFAPDGELVLVGVDVGGIYRSLDGGRTFEPANVGYMPRGCGAFAVDPGNPSRVLAVGVNSAVADHHGLYLSEDRAGSWRHVLPVEMSGIHEQREQIAFDPATYDAAQGRTLVAYWSRGDREEPGWGTVQPEPGIVRSEDGGETWQALPGTKQLGGSILRVDPERAGRVYAGNRRGLWVSEDSGVIWTLLVAEPVYGLDYQRGRLAYSSLRGVFVSDSPDRPGASFRQVGGSLVPARQEGLDDSTAATLTLSLDQMAALNEDGQVEQMRRVAGWPEGEVQILHNLKISPANPDHMVVWRQPFPNNWQWPRFATRDGGETWTEATVDSSRAFLPQNSRQGLFAWHPTDPEVVLSMGGDWVTRSDDGGRTFRWANQGNNAVLVGGRFAFSLDAPDVLFCASQDYNGFVTEDRGHTWTYLNPAGNGWGGFTYGGYAVTRDFLIVGNAAGWGAPRILRVSHDGGQTWKDTGITLTGPDTSYGLPGNPDIAFAFDHRTADGGRTWTRMEGCLGVMAHAGDALFGVGQGGVVRSDDAGRTWTLLAAATSDVKDVAVTPDGRTVFAVIGDRAYRLNGETWEDLNIPGNTRGADAVKTVAVDPVDPAVVYVGSAGNWFAASNAVVRSTDGGRTWTVLTVQEPLRPGLVDGGREALCIRVHPVTREVFVSTSCYGIWKYPAP